MIQKSWLATKVSLGAVRSSTSTLTYKREIIKAGTRAAPRVDTRLKRHPWRSQHEALLDVLFVDEDDAEQRGS